MKITREILKRFLVPTVLAVAAVFFFLVSVADRTRAGNGFSVSSKIENRLEKRLGLLDRHAAQAVHADPQEWVHIASLPEDMVLYRYCCDTLQSWQHLFPTGNDDIRSRLMYQRISRPEFGLCSPLATIGEEWEYVSIGPKWYVARCVSEGEVKVIAALEICNMPDGRTVTDINRKLVKGDEAQIFPVTGNVGYPVSCDGKVLFVSIPFPDKGTLVFANSVFRWIGLVLLIFAFVLFLERRKNWLQYAVTAACFTVMLFVARGWGFQMEGNTGIFSPAVYAGNGFLSSFGFLVIVDVYIFLMALSAFLMRDRMKPGPCGVAVIAVAAAAVLAYGAYSVASLVGNSTISFIFNWFGGEMAYSAIAIFSTTLLLISVMMLCQMAEPFFRGRTGKSFNVFSYRNIFWISVVFALLLFGVSSLEGFRKEKAKAQSWSDRLSVDRNLEMEMTLRASEDAIAGDAVIALLSGAVDGGSMITNRIIEKYFSRLSDEFDIKVSICPNNDVDCILLFNRKMSGGVPVAPSSRFVCVYDAYGHAGYTGLFNYTDFSGRTILVFLEISSKANRQARGYYSIFDDVFKKGSVWIPEKYSYARYMDDRLVTYKGTFAYPVVMGDEVRAAAESSRGWFAESDVIHFVNRVGDGEVTVISRARRGVLANLSAALTLIASVLLILLLIAFVNRQKVTGTHRQSFRRQITMTINIAIFISLVSLAVVSIKFVFDRNRTDSYNLMSSKISTLQTLVESRCKDVESFSELVNQEFRTTLIEMSSNTRSDITLFAPDGTVFISTVGEVYEKLALSPRINDEAFRDIVIDHKRMSIVRESFRGRGYSALYAPVFNGNDQPLAIISTPYSPGNSVMQEAIPHAILLIIIALTLLVLFSTIAGRVISSLLRPLSEISGKMEGATLHDLESIEYSRDDEIKPLIDSYNVMVRDLAESARLMAETERNNAWSQMARQVAHEIKNPLTPIKLKIQSLVRMKQKNDPSWSDRFDSVSQIVLEHIDILTDTANEFSTFAKLYTEDPVEVDLDRTLQDQVSIFDNKENISISYLGLHGAVIMGPRPQLIRVFVNLITNAIQAIENEQRARVDRGEESFHGQIGIQLRLGPGEDSYDIVFEDNGPGVPEENLSKLFTPNFTTKSGGTGLGLAMCHSIVEKCDGEIFYRKSDSLKGASFTVRLPRR